MKVAVCISGNIRTWFKIHKDFGKIFEKLNPDFFIHTYDSSDCYRENYILPAIGPESTNRMTVNFANEDIKHLIDALYPQTLVIENMKEIEKMLIDMYPDVIVNSQTLIVACQLRKRYLCNELRKEHEKKNNIKYDWVIRTRFDLKYNFDPLTIEKLSTLQKDIMYLPPKINSNCHNDQFALSSPELMDIYCFPFTHIKEMKNSCCAHILFGTYVEPHICKWNYDFPVEIIRPSKEDINLSSKEIIKIFHDS